MNTLFFTNPASVHLLAVIVGIEKRQLILITHLAYISFHFKTKF